MALVLASHAHATGLLTLQNANGIGIAGLINATVSNTGNSTATEGIAWTSSQAGTLTVSSGVTLTGTVYEGNTGQVTTTPSGGSCGRASGGCVVDSSDLGASGILVSNANSDYSTAAGLTATQTFTNITSAATITGATNGSDTNVIKLSGIDLTSANLTLSGNASEYFILQIAGTIVLNNSANIQLSGGLLASHVLYVFTGTNNVSVTSASGDIISGTLLAANGTANYTMALQGTVDGMIVNDGTTTVNGLTVNGGSNGFAGTPEPGTWVMLGAGLAGLGLFELYRRKRNPAPAAA
jgi:hypothetical protein